MNLELLNKLSRLSFYGFFDPSKGVITVHFFNEQEENRADVIAYLRRDMSWDVREIIDEKAVLYDDKEVVTISQKKIGIEKHDSDFDKFVQIGLRALGKQKYGEEAILEDKDIMFRILTDNSYKDN